MRLKRPDAPRKETPTKTMTRNRRRKRNTHDFGRQHPENTASLVVPPLFLLTAQLGWLASLFLLTRHPSALLREQWSQGFLLAVVHLFTLGFLTMTMMGILHQLVPVTLNTKPWSTRIVIVHYGLMVTGTILFSAGFVNEQPLFIMVGAIAISLAILYFVALILYALRHAQGHPFHGPFILSSMGYLALTVVLGVTLAWNYAYGLGLASSFIVAHIAVAAGGFAAFLLMGLSYKLSVMFFPSKSAPRHGTWVFYLLHAAVLTEFLAGFTGWHLVTAGIAIFTAASGLYLWDMIDIWLMRRNSYPDPVLFTIGLGTLSFAAAWILLGLWALSPSNSHLASAAIFMFFEGWFGLSILGYSQKILPFVLWLHRYSHVHGQGKVPRLNEIFPEDWSWQIMMLSAAGLVLSYGGLILSSVSMFRTGLITLSLGVARMHFASWRALLRHPVHQDNPKRDFRTRIRNW